MDKELTFNYIVDIDGNRKCYPKDPQLVSLFMCPNDSFDLEYYIYAACTKPDFSNSELVHVNKTVYDETKSFFAEQFDSQLGENLMDNVDDIYLILYGVRDAVETEFQTIGEMLKLDENA